jgi:DnaJ-class molecular chaperone
MVDHSKVVPMRSIRETLNEIERMIEMDEDQQSPCPLCNGTGTEVIREGNEARGARPCKHGE